MKYVLVQYVGYNRGACIEIKNKKAQGLVGHFSSRLY